jgi:hypothetical protein
MAFLLVFLLANLFINFIHCEKKVRSDHFCPACQFQNSTLATNQINFFQLPQLALLEILKSFESFPYIQIFFIHPSSRSPPLI